MVLRTAFNTESVVTPWDPIEVSSTKIVSLSLSKFLDGTKLSIYSLISSFTLAAVSEGSAVISIIFPEVSST